MHLRPTRHTTRTAATTKRLRKRRRIMMHQSTCGRFVTGGNRVPGCEHVDHGSCGNACCAVQLMTRQSPSSVYQDLREWLSSGGADGSYRYMNGTDAAGHRPSDRLGSHVPDGEGGVTVKSQGRALSSGLSNLS